MQSKMKIGVTGASGRLGRQLLDVLGEAGHDVVPMSRTSGVDVITGAGLDAALEGVDCVIDAATSPSPDEREATAFFRASAANIQSAA
jgi:nucleoside-diphosphate-sugar epimerase